MEAAAFNQFGTVDMPSIFKFNTTVMQFVVIVHFTNLKSFSNTWTKTFRDAQGNVRTFGDYESFNWWQFEIC